MITPEEKYNKRRLRTSYISSVISITLVLFMLGIIGLLLIHSKKISDYVRENFSISVYIKDNVKEVDIVNFQKSLNAFDFVLKTEYISKEKAAELLKNDLGEDFVSFLGYNPLPSSIDLRLKSPYANNDSLVKIKEILLKNEKVKEVDYQPPLIQKMNDNIRRISLILFGISVLFFFIALALINSTIRLAVFSKRLLIKSMRLVGATNSFISRPFIKNGIIQGVISSLITIAFLTGIIELARRELPDIISLQRDIDSFLLLFATIIVLGIVLTWITTWFAVRKYLKIKTIDLF